MTRLLCTASKKSTLRMVIWGKWVGKPHDIWEATRGAPQAARAAAIRIRLLAERSDLQASSWKRHRGESPVCPLCDREDEDAEHFLVACEALTKVREQDIKNLQKIYIEDLKRTPETPDEVASAILNGFGFYPGVCRQQGSQPKPSLKKSISTTEDIFEHYTLAKSSALKANILCNKLCARLYKERDIMINNKLMDIC